METLLKRNILYNVEFYLIKLQHSNVWNRLVGISMGTVLKQVSKISGVYGQPGEEKVSATLEENLPGEFVILNSPRVSYHGATIDIDHVVIGPNGIFVIESKNMHGKITGGLMGNWLQERKRSGATRRVKIGNPANQVNQYAKILKSYIGGKYAHEYNDKLPVKVYPVVVFVHEEADLTGMDYTKPGTIGRVRILTVDGLVSYICSREGAQYTAEEIDRLAKLTIPPDQRDQTSYFTPEMLADAKDKFSQRYEIYEELGRGSFGVVYRGFDFKLDREVAIKKMQNSRKNEPEAVQRFFREAQITSRLHHENIAAVYDYYEEDSDYYLIMEYVDGFTVQEFVEKCLPDMHEVYQIIDGIAAAVQYAHEQNVIHRDLKPANIIITPDMKIKVTDFGIARLTENSLMTQSVHSLGTPTTMSPEQIRGADVDERSDIFGLGILLYYLATGEMPFQGEHLGEVVHKVMNFTPVSPGELNPAISPELEEIILKALEKDRKDRYQKVAEFRSDLAANIGTGNTATTAGAGLTARMRRQKWFRRLPKAVKNLLSSDKKLYKAVIVVTLAVFLGMFGFQAYRDSRQATEDYLHPKQYGFTNDNLNTLFANPRGYEGIPATIVGRIDKIIKLTDNTTLFSLNVESKDNLPTTNILVSYNEPHFMMQYATFIRVTGSVKNPDPGNREKAPFILADKVEPIDDPWTVLAPTRFTLRPIQTINYNGQIVQLDKIEFSDTETRMFVRVRNETRDKSLFILSKPRGLQGNREFKELPNKYGVYSQATLQLFPMQEAREIIFLERMDPMEKNLTFILGDDDEILTQQKPFVFKVKW